MCSYFHPLLRYYIPGNESTQPHSVRTSQAYENSIYYLLFLSNACHPPHLHVLKLPSTEALHSCRNKTSPNIFYNNYIINDNANQYSTCLYLFHSDFKISLFLTEQPHILSLGHRYLTPLSQQQKPPAPEEFSGAGVIFMPPLSIYQALLRD